MILPIDELLPSIGSALKEQNNLVLTAAPGAGKTTRVAPYLIRSEILSTKKPEVLLLQPRRIAARSIAARIAHEQKWKLGEEVGYQVRFENRTSPNTRLKLMTEGILIRRLQQDPYLENVSLVVLDEFHERSIHTDLSLALLRQLQLSVRDDLKILANDLPVYWSNWYAAGAMYSTAGDILKFANALFNGKLLKQETLNQMFTSGLGEYGFGVWVYKDYKINDTMYTIVKRPGSIMGAQAMLFHVLEDGATIIILCNTGTVSLDDLAANIAEKLIY